MASNNPNDNPWNEQRDEGQGHQSHNPYQAYQAPPPNPYGQPPASGSYGQHPPQDSYGQHPPPHEEASPWGQEQGHAPSYNPNNPYTHGQSNEPPQPSYYQDYHDETSRPSYPGQEQTSQPSYPGQEEVPPGLPPRRTATDMALPTGQDRSHQIEVMQSYEAAGRKDEDDDNVEVLQREFPKIDGSLIAAIYGDSKSLSATREMLQALE